MRNPPLSDEQRRILDGLTAGRRLLAVVRRRGTTRTIAIGFSETEVVHKHALDGLISKRLIDVKQGEFFKL